MGLRIVNYMFYIIGLGLCDEKDITVRGLEVSTFPTNSEVDAKFSSPTGCQKVITSIFGGIYQYLDGPERAVGKFLCFR